MSLDRLGQLGSLSSWGLFNWPLIAVWRAVPMKDLSSNLWRAFSPKWVVTRRVNQLPLEVPRQKKESLPLEPPQMIFLKALTLSFKSLTFSAWRSFCKLICGTKVTTPIRSLFYDAALLAAWSAAWFPCATSVIPFWCPLQWETETSVSRWTTSKCLRIWSPHLIGDPWMVKWLLSFQIAACACSTRKAYLESV